jgi:hypothetical protein
MQVHRFGIAGGHDEGCTFALLRTDGSEDIGGSGALIAGRAWSGAALGRMVKILVRGFPGHSRHLSMVTPYLRHRSGRPAARRRGKARLDLAVRLVAAHVPGFQGTGAV